MPPESGGDTKSPMGERHHLLPMGGGSPRGRTLSQQQNWKCISTRTSCFMAGFLGGAWPISCTCMHPLHVANALGVCVQTRGGGGGEGETVFGQQGVKTLLQSHTAANLRFLIYLHIYF